METVPNGAHPTLTYNSLVAAFVGGDPSQNLPTSIKDRIESVFFSAVGSEDNPASNLALAEQQRAFDEYRMRWPGILSTLSQCGSERSPVEFRLRFPSQQLRRLRFVADTQNFMSFLPWGLFHVGHRVTGKEWKFQLPAVDFFSFAINLHANVPAVAERRTGKFSNGRSYPGLVDELRGSLQMVNLISPLIIVYSWICETDVGVGVGSISITNSRFDIFVGHPCTTKGEGLLVWD